MTQFSLPIFTIFAFLTAISPHVLIAQQLKNPYENMDSFRLFQTSKSPFSQFAKNVSLSSVLENLARSHEIDSWIDRRVDRDQSVSLSSDTNSTVQSTLDKLAADCECEIAYLNQIVYFAPKTQGAIAEFAYWNLFMATQTIATQPITTQIDPSTKVDSSWKSVDRWQWSNPTQPSELFLDRSKQLSMRIENLDLIEHDLWGPQSLPAADFAAQWSCVLTGFASTLRPVSHTEQGQLEQRHWFIEPTAKSENVSFEYTPKQMASVGKTQFTDWKATWPNTSVKKTPSGSWKIDAPVAAQRDFLRRASALEIDRIGPRLAKPRSKPSVDNSRFSLKLQGTLGAVLEALRAQASIEVIPWPLPVAAKDRRITLDLKEVTLDALLQSIAREANLEIIRDDKKVTVRIP